ncbi:MAG: hypothetical protein V4660_01205 [Pseudomonadota bacterium]
MAGVGRVTISEIVGLKMELSQKEKIISLTALHKYREYLELQLGSEELDEETYADIANDASLLEILIYKAEQELKQKT